MVYRVASAHEEGGERVYAVSTAAFRGENGRVRTLVIDEVDVSDGRPIAREGTRREIPAQLVLLAMGFTGTPKDGVVGQLGLDIDERGRIRRTDDFGTAIDGVFVAGDAGRGQSLIVWAIAEGRSAAAAADRYLRGETELPAPITASTMQLLI